MSYLPFWLGGAALAVVAVGYCVLLRRLLGVSGSFAIALGARAAPSDIDPAALESALELATAEAFGEQPEPAGPAASTGAPPVERARPLPRAAHITLIGPPSSAAWTSTQRRSRSSSD